MKVNEYFKYSWFSDLAYVRWNDENTDTTSNIINAAHDAKRIPGDPDHPGVDNLGDLIFMEPGDGGLGWKILDFHPNDAVGFAASLYGDGKEKVLAIRGTETSEDQKPLDLIQADLKEIGVLGMAISQFVSLYNYIQPLRTPATASPIQLEFHQSDSRPDGIDAAHLIAADDRYFWVTTSKDPTLKGRGKLSTEDQVTITGHSLGGHLAAIAMRLFPDLFDQAVTFNAPGTDPDFGLEERASLGTAIASLLLSVPAGLTYVLDKGEKLTDQFLTRLIAPYHDAAVIEFDDPLLDGRIHTLVSESEYPDDDIDLITSTLTGRAPSPSLPVTTEVNSHSMSQLVDALAVQALFERVAPDIDLAAAGRLIAAASNEGKDSLERISGALYRLFVDPHAADPAISVPLGLDYVIQPPTPFDARAQLHEQLLAIERFLDEHPGLQLVSLLDKSPEELRSLAHTDIAYRYALLHANPFAILGKDDVATAALYAPHNADHRLDRYRPDTGTGHLSDSQLRDRAVLLAAVIESNTADQLPLPNGWTTSTQPLMEKTVFEDLASGHRFAGRGAPIGGSARPATARQVVFGTDDADTLTGGSLSDHLYGMAGDDMLEGGAGDDYLEGGPGNDQYVSNSGDGRDRIFDSDGQGRILIDGDLLIGGEPIGDSLWQSTDGRHRFALSGEGSLHIDGRIRVEGFQNGDLGIELSPDATPEDTTGTLLEDPAPHKVLSSELEGGDADAPYDAYGGAGNDLILTARAGDLLDGGPGDDWMASGAGDDRLRGAEGNDALFPGEGADTATGGAGNDLIVDAQYRLFNSSGGDSADAETWRAMGGRFAISLLADPYLDDAGEITQAYTLLLPSESFAGDSADGPFRYDPIDATHGRITFDAGPELIVSYETWGSPDTAPNAFSGGAGNDYLAGNAGPDLLAGDDGNDSLLGGRGDDDLIGGSGDDLLLGQQDRDLLDGGAGEDRLFGGSNEDILHGGSGDDLLVGDNDQQDRGAADRLFGDAGDDVLHGNGGGDWLDGGTGHDVLWGHDGDDTLLGGDGDDVLHGDDGDDLLYGGAGTDQLDGGAGDDGLAGGGGADLYLIGSASGQDWIDESGTDTDRLQFAAGIALGSLRYRREEDDLQIDLPGGNGVRLKGFFERNLSYLLRDADGTERLINPALIETALAPAHWLSMVELDALYTRAIEENTASVLAPLGFAQEDAGHWTREQTDRFGRVTTHRTTLTTLTAGAPDGDYLRTLPTTVESTTAGTDPGAGRTIETRIQRLDLTLGDGADRFEIEDKYRLSLNRVDGGAGDDVLDASVGRDYWGRGPVHLPLSSLFHLPADLFPGSLLYGNTGDDHLIGSDGGDYLIGGPGNDAMRGGMGSDLYVIDGGHDLVFDDGGLDRGSDRLLLPAEATPETIRYQWREVQASNIHVADYWAGRMTSLHRALTLEWGSEDSVTLILPHTDQRAGYGIDQVIFGDGRSVPMEALLAAAAFSGNADPQQAANRLRGNQFLHGYEGDDELRADTPDLPIEIGWSSRYDAVLIGGAGRDTLEGNLGRDLLIGGDIAPDYSHDHLLPIGTLEDPGNRFDGGPGNDEIWTTAGSDLILFGEGDGNDSVRDLVHDDANARAYSSRRTSGGGAGAAPAYPAGFEDSEDILRFKAGIGPDDIHVRRGRGKTPPSDALIFEHRNGADSLTFEHWFDVGHNQLSRVEFADGYFWDRDDIDALLRGEPANLAPSPAGTLPSLPALVPGHEITIGLPALFTDPEGSILEYHLASGTGDALPDWLRFDPASRTLSGSVPADLADPLALTLTVRDEKGKPASLALTLEVDGDAATATPPPATTSAGEVATASPDVTAVTAATHPASPEPAVPVEPYESEGTALYGKKDAAAITTGDPVEPTTTEPAPLDLDWLTAAGDASDIATEWPFASTGDPIEKTSAMPAAAVSVSTADRWVRVRTALKSLDATDHGRRLGERLGASGYRVAFSTALHGPSPGTAPRGSVIGLRSDSLTTFSGLREGFHPGHL